MITRSDNRGEFHPKPVQEYERKLVSGSTYTDWASTSELETTLDGAGYVQSLRTNKYFWIGGIYYFYDGSTYIPIGGTISDVLYKNRVFIEAGVSSIPGGGGTWPSGVNTVTIPGFVSWDIEPERIGSGSMIPGVHYSWNSTTGVMTLLVSGDVFGYSEYFCFRFGLKDTGTP
jgi:hypothetical protein